MSNNEKHQTKLQLRLYPEKNEQHRCALAWLMEHKTDGISYADLVSQVICSQINRKQDEASEERLRQIIREEIRSGLRTVTIKAVPVAAPPQEPPKPAEKSLNKAKGFMAGMGFG